MRNGFVSPNCDLSPEQLASEDEKLAAVTQQEDAGIRFAVSPDFKIVAGAFRITKPLYDLDPTNLFTNVGDVTHEGFEFSASGRVTKDLAFVGGLLLLYPKVEGTLVDAGLIGAVPPTRSARSLRLNVQYEVPFTGVSLDAQVQYDSSQYTNPSNLLQVPALTIFDIGWRYRFLAWDAPATLRMQIFNVADAYEWMIGPSRAGSLCN